MYGQIPPRKSSWPTAEAAAKDQMTPEVVDAEQIAAVVSRWTGVPVEKMLEGEREKLLRMEDVLRLAWSARKTPWPPCPTPCAGLARVCRIPTGLSAPSCSWGPPASARPN